MLYFMLFNIKYLDIAILWKDLAESKIRYTFALGEMAEWSIAAVLKTVVLRGTRGSNPCLSAESPVRRKLYGIFCF